MYTLGYGRKSVVRRGVDTISVDKQRLAIAELADKRGEELVWFEDAEGHRSGRSERARPGYQRLIARLQGDSSVRSVIFYELDRAARSVVLIDRILKLCQDKNVAFICIKEGIDTSKGLGANEITRIQLLAVLAEGEANRVAERMSDTARYYREQLHIPWGMWPFGVARSGEGDAARFDPDPPHDGAVRQVMTLYCDGHGYRDTALAMNRLGYFHVDRYGRQKAFNTETIRSIVGNVLFYAGYAIGVRFRAKQARVTLDGDEGSYLDRYVRAMRAVRSPAITPLIDDGMASAVVERRFKSQLTGRRPNGWVALLTPILYWKDQRLRAQTRDYGNFYRARGREGACFDGDRIETSLLGHLRDVHFTPQMRTDVRRTIEETIGASARAEFERRQAKVMGEMDMLIDLLSASAIDREIYNTRYVRLESQLKAVRQQMQAPDNVDTLMDTLNNVFSALERMTPRKRKIAIQDIFERVDLSDEGEITRIQMREWAREPFKQIAAAINHGSGVPTMPPVSTDDDVGTNWYIRRAA